MRALNEMQSGFGHEYLVWYINLNPKKKKNHDDCLLMRHSDCRLAYYYYDIQPKQLRDSASMSVTKVIPE